jgi:hypothetical protein
MAPPSLSFGISLRQHPAELFEERDLEFESVFLQRGVGCEPDFLGDAGKQRSAGFTDPPKLPLQIFFGWIGTRDRRVPEESTAA